MSGGCYSDHWRKQIEPATFPAQLKANGYQTFYAGKYLNQVGRYEAIASGIELDFLDFQSIASAHLRANSLIFLYFRAICGRHLRTATKFSIAHLKFHLDTMTGMVYMAIRDITITPSTRTASCGDMAMQKGTI